MIVPGLLLLLAGPPADTVATPGAASAPRAAAHRDSVLMLPEVRVERERVPSEAQRRLPTAFVSEQVAGVSGRAFETLPDLLGEVAGARVLQYGGLGAFSTVSLRGASPGQVTVFLDGLPVTSAGHTVVSLGDLPASATRSLEVFRGVSPLGLGAAAPGGAVNLVTASAPEGGTLRLARGAFGTWEARAGAGGGHGTFSGTALAGYQASRGDFRYRDDNGTPFNPDDDSLSTRVNDRFESLTLLGALEWRPGPRWRVAARENLFRKAQGVPGVDVVPALATHLSLTRASSQLEITREGAGAVPTARVRARRADERTRFRDPHAELGLGAHDTDDRLGGDDAALDLAWERLPRSLSLTTTASYRVEHARPTDAADGAPDPPPSRRATTGAAAILQWHPRGGRLVVHGALRRDALADRLRWTEVGGLARASEVRRTLVSPQLGVRLTMPHGVVGRANVSSARRAPDFLELFGNDGSVLGNPALLPERGRAWDAGASWSRALPGGLAASVDLAHFSSRLADMIVYRRYSQSSVRADNIASARIDGEELTARLEAPHGLGLTAELTRMTTRDTGPYAFWAGRRLPLRPALQGALRLDWRHGGFRVVGDLQYIGDDYLDRANLQPVPARTLLGTSVSFAPRGGALTFTVEGRNLGDDHVSDVGGFPLPGRACFVSCDARLGAAERHPR